MLLTHYDLESTKMVLVSHASIIQFGKFWAMQSVIFEEFQREL